MKLYVAKKVIDHSVTVRASGAKNALLHLMFATLLPNDATELTNVPTALDDFHGANNILTYLGATTQVDEADEKVVIQKPTMDRHGLDIPLSLTRQTRCSLMLLGSLVKQVGTLTIGYPGGCAFSDRRPFDIHLDGLDALGAEVCVQQDTIRVTHQQDQDATYRLRCPSVGATINLLLYSTIGQATVTLTNIAIEPEVMSVIEYLQQCGAQIQVSTANRWVQVVGVNQLKGISFPIMYDRIQTMTFAAFAYLHRCLVTIEGIDDLTPIQGPLNVLSQAGGRWRYDPIKQSLFCDGQQTSLQGIKIQAAPYPAFPTDLQPIYAVMLSQANTPSYIQDTVYPERVKYIDELKKMGFPAQVNEQTIYIRPLKTTQLAAAHMQSHDLRAGMACLMAGSLVEATSQVTHARQIFRGYNHLLTTMQHFMLLDKDD